MGDHEPSHQIYEVLSGVPEAVPRARQLVVNSLRAWGLTGVVEVSRVKNVAQIRGLRV
jgi:hypothetical protein